MSHPVDSLQRTASPPEEPSKHKSHSFFQNVFVGSASGITAISVIQPMIYFKNSRQANATGTALKSFEKNPRVWYRGVGGSAASFAPTVALQTAANGIFSEFCNPFVSASAAGVVSALIVCPSDGIMVQQQKTGLPFWATAKHIHSSHGIWGFYKAFKPTAIREGFFTGAYLGAAPIMKEQLCASGVNEWLAQLIAGIGAGAIAAGITHPFDTLKTLMQRDLSMQMSLTKAVFQKNAFAGFGWRFGIVATATTVMPFVQEKLHAKLKT